MTTSAADPDALTAYASAGIDLDDGLLRAAPPLGAALDRFRATSPDATVAVPALDQDVGGHAAGALEHDAWVGQVGHAFALAGRGGTMGPFLPGAVTVADTALLPLVGGESPDWMADALDEVGGFLLGDIVNIWTGGDDGMPYGSVGAGLLRVARVRTWLRAARAAQAAGLAPDLLTGIMAVDRFPTANTGFVARGLTSLPGVNRLRPLISNPATTQFLRRAGVGMGVISTGLDTYNLVQQGNPVDAYQREGAGYVADVFQTGFSASTTAFMAFPNPYTGAAVIITGLGWAGAEAWDAWGDDISGWAGDRWDDSTEWAGEAWDDSTEWAGDRLDDAGEVLDDIGEGIGDTASAVNDRMPWNW
ncbi:hypothetical protein BH20ACT2_BH20ACT2_23780 [soil metagenome]